MASATTSAAGAAGAALNLNLGYSLVPEGIGLDSEINLSVLNIGAGLNGNLTKLTVPVKCNIYGRNNQCNNKYYSYSKWRIKGTCFIGKLNNNLIILLVWVRII